MSKCKNVEKTSVGWNNTKSDPISKTRMKISIAVNASSQPVLQRNGFMVIGALGNIHVRFGIFIYTWAHPPVHGCARFDKFS